jgi:hypothetical protein
MIENAYVCYADVLGFTSRFISGDLSSRYDKLIKMVNDIEDPGITVFLMSDSIVIISLEFKKFRDTVKEFYTWGILNDFWLRGAITQGNVTRYHEIAATEQNRFILPFLGDGYMRAYAIETTLNMSGIAIDQKFFDSDDLNPGFRKGVDYIEYEEYQPKIGYEGKKKLLLPREHSLRQVLETMYFEEMLGSHVEDLDKYINTFCFYLQQLLERANTANLILFVEKITEEFEQQGRRILMPTGIVTIFIAMVEGLLNRYRSIDKVNFSSRDQLEMLIGRIISALKEEGYLAVFVDNILDFDKRRRTSIYKEINSLRSRIPVPATEGRV